VSYRVEYLESVLNDDIPKLAKRARGQISRAIETRLTTYPIDVGKPLRYSLKGARRLRVGDYRVVYRVEPPDTVLVIKIGHRKDVYGR